MLHYAQYYLQSIQDASPEQNVYVHDLSEILNLVSLQSQNVTSLLATHPIRPDFPGSRRPVEPNSPSVRSSMLTVSILRQTEIVIRC